METKISRFVMLWVCITSIFLYAFISGNQENRLFQIGPNPNLLILGICVDTHEKYVIVVSFCFVNSGFRCLNHNILQSWLINTVQNKAVFNVNTRQSYEISFISTIYNWFDFFMYMNILMSQIDMLMVEIISDLIMTTIITKHYLHLKKNNRIIDETTHLMKEYSSIRI